MGSNACVLAQPSPPAGVALPGLTYLFRVHVSADGVEGDTGGGYGLVGVTEDHNLLVHDGASLGAKRTIVGYNDEITDLRYVALRGACSAKLGASCIIKGVVKGMFNVHHRRIPGRGAGRLNSVWLSSRTRKETAD